jgi:hypothetical protein
LCICSRYFGVVLALLDLLLGQLARADRVATGQLGRGGIVGDRLHLEDVEAAEFGDLLEGERAVVDQPRSGRMGHAENNKGLRPLDAI